MKKLISIDLRADFGFLKKPDTNNPMYLTFNMLHKPALLGILGAILGLEGFKAPPSKRKKKAKEVQTELFPDEETEINPMPEYYQKLKDLKVGIQPIGAEKGNFSKTVIQYNNGVGYANLDGGNLIVIEQTLVAPAYRCFLLLDDTDSNHQKLIDYLKNNKAEYLPYLGKNDFSVWWDKYSEYGFFKFKSTEPFKVDSIFLKKSVIKGNEHEDPLAPILGLEKGSFIYFENLPVQYDLELMQYAEYQPFAYTDFHLKQRYEVDNLIRTDTNAVVQLF